MNDTYIECMVKRTVPSYAMAVKAIMFVFCAVGAVIAILTPLGIVALVLIGAATYFTIQNLDLEFEYLYINGQLSIDKIMGKAKRKKVWEGDMEQVQLVALTDAGLVKNYTANQLRTYDCSSKNPQIKTYSLIAQSGAAKVKIIFEPNDALLQVIKQKYPSKVSI